MKKRLLALFSSIVLVVGMFAGCASQSSASQTSAAQGTGTGKKVTLEFFHQKPENVDLYKKLATEFMNQNPDVQLNVTLAETTTTTLLSRIAANSTPEIMAIFPMSASYVKLEKEGIFADLTNQPCLKQVNQKILKDCSVDGKYYTLPLTLNAYGMYYNVDIFKKLNLTPPKTFDELWTVCGKLKQAGIQPFSFPDKETTRISQFFDRMLVGCVNHDFATENTKIANGSMDLRQDANFKNYANAILKLRENGNKASLGYGDTQAYEEFTSGKSAMYIDGTWAVTTFQKMNPKLNFNCTAIPTLSEKEFYTSGTIDTSFAISDKVTDDQMKAAVKFLDFIVSPKVAQEFCDGDKNPNLVNSVKYNLPQLKEINDMISNGKFKPAMSTLWTQDLRTGLNKEVQDFIARKNVDKFVGNVNDAIKQYSKES